ncbi:GlsB/YeaQ/YmgE family stress response membrane protein, partial [candidate division KSB1 bacterium]
LAGTIMKGSGFGLIGNLVVGVIGALLGGFIFDVLSIQSYGLIGSLVMSVVGAVALLALIRVIKKA